MKFFRDAPDGRQHRTGKNISCAFAASKAKAPGGKLVYILTNGITGRVFEDVLMRDSYLPSEGDAAAAVYAGLKGFLAHLVVVAPADARRLVVL